MSETTMQTNPESAAVEAVAWVGPLGQLIKNDRFQARVNGLPDHGDLSTYTALYPQSALDALRGEVVSMNARCIELGERIARLADLRASDAAYIKKLDGIIEETGVRPVSCINPYEDLKAVVLSLKKRAAEADAAERRVAELLDAIKEYRLFASCGNREAIARLDALTKESP